MTTTRALLAAEAQSLDFVDIATPPSDHAEVAHAALDAGLHVLCEKPLATTIEDARAHAAPRRRRRARDLPVPQLQARAGDQDGARRSSTRDGSARSTW